MWYEVASHKNCLISALDVMEAQGEVGPLQPKHLRGTVRRLCHPNGMPHGHPHRLWFRIWLHDEDLLMFMFMWCKGIVDTYIDVLFGHCIM
jgi:hypothetical protein